MGQRVFPFEHICPTCEGTFLAYRRDSRRFCSKSCASQTRNHSRGPAHCNYRGGIYIEPNGRAWITTRSGTQWGYARGVMEAALGRELSPFELVHHINGDPSDDRLENLQLVTRAEHCRIHKAELTAARQNRKALAA